MFGPLGERIWNPTICCIYVETPIAIAELLKLLGMKIIQARGHVSDWLKIERIVHVNGKVFNDILHKCYMKNNRTVKIVYEKS